MEITSPEPKDDFLKIDAEWLFYKMKSSIIFEKIKVG